MTFFNKKKGNLEENGFSGKTPDYFKKSIEDGKLKIIDWLNHKTSGYSTAKKKTALIILCILASGMCLYILENSIYGRGFNTRNLIITHLNPGANSNSKYPISDSIFQEAVRIQRWLDSIRQNDTPRFKAILLSKPFLFDNLQLIEHLYKIQTK